VDVNKVRRLPGLLRHNRGRREQQRFQLCVVGISRKRPTEPRGRKTHEILGDGASGDFTAGGDLSLGQMQKGTGTLSTFEHMIGMNDQLVALIRLV